MRKHKFCIYKIIVIIQLFFVSCQNEEPIKREIQISYYQERELFINGELPLGLELIDVTEDVYLSNKHEKVYRLIDNYQNSISVMTLFVIDNGLISEIYSTFESSQKEDLESVITEISSSYKMFVCEDVNESYDVCLNGGGDEIELELNLYDIQNGFSLSVFIYEHSSIP